MNETTTGPARIPLQLELDPGSEPISGRLTGPDGGGEDFVGWLALSAALERLIVAGEPGGPAGGRPAPSRKDVNRAP